MLPDNISRYLAKKGVSYGHTLDINSLAPLNGAIIIPALAELENIPGLIESLTLDITLSNSKFAVVFIVNHRTDASNEVKVENLRTIELLKKNRNSLNFPVGIIDASNSGFELPLKGGGVGMARKIGHDLLLPKLNYINHDPILVSLDADTKVKPGYTEAIVKHFKSAATGGAVIPFAHQKEKGEGEENAIVKYELFLRCYVAALMHAKSPYAFHTVGSAMACRASAYVNCGGMNTKMAGEDFYFLQALAKSDGVQQVCDTCVFPSSRRSWRVPFGTGRAVSSLLDNEPEAVLFYHPASFKILESWLSMALQSCEHRNEDLPDKSGEISLELRDFLQQQGFATTWNRFLKQHKTPGTLNMAFNCWFDAFRTMKMLHYLSDTVYPRGEPEDILDLYPESWAGSKMSINDRLAYLREIQS